MKKIVIPLILLIISFYIFMACNSENTTEIMKGKFENPYAFAGEGHNFIIKEYLKSEQKFNLNNFLIRLKEFVKSKTLYADVPNWNGSVEKRLSANLIFIKRGKLSKVTTYDFIDSLFNSIASKGAITLEHKNKIMEFINIILSANGDTSLTNDFCSNLSEDTDNVTKAHILMVSSIYNASQRLWSAQHFNKTEKAQVGIIAADAIGGAIGGAVYALDAWFTGSKWSWGHFASSVIGGLLLQV